jgi:hypothetical protein
LERSVGEISDRITVEHVSFQNCILVLAAWAANKSELEALFISRWLFGAKGPYAIHNFKLIAEAAKMDSLFSAAASFNCS